MRIAEGIEMLQLEVQVMGAPAVICPVLLRQGGEVVLIDTGFPGNSCYPKLMETLAALGVAARDITHVVLTHQDLDHIGGLPLLLQENPHIRVCCHAEEKSYIEGEKRLVKYPAAMRSNLDKLLEPMKKALLQTFENPPTAQVDTLLADNEVLPWCGGVTVIHTPGHTPGHISLYLHTAKTLVAGDALTAQSGKLLGPVPEHAQDIAQARESLKKLLPFDIRQVVCYHGGFAGMGNARIQEIIDEK